MSLLQNKTIKARSWLFTPATRPERFSKASEAGADILIVDLEDSVALDQKNDARANVEALLEDGAKRLDLPKLAVRINHPHSLAGHDDLSMLVASASVPEFIMLPKVESTEQIQSIVSLFRDVNKSVLIVPLVESIKGLNCVDAVAGCDSVYGVMFGAADYASDARIQPDSLAMQLARCRVASACAMAGVKAIDAPCFTIHDAQALRDDLTFAQKNGFSAKAAIHPLHIEAINEAFTPSAARIDWARRVIAVSERGVGVVDGRMVDEAIAREAREVLSYI
ncbi:aldolase/citrate lyase family protein [Paraburkholderia sediminicola]|uniref:aldolase/citrate lyase family protein n=1 Tax=Paraburkholderia sediminicola TaxID=458836 RepID=UPI0038B86261